MIELTLGAAMLLSRSEKGAWGVMQVRLRRALQLHAARVHAARPTAPAERTRDRIRRRARRRYADLGHGRCWGGQSKRGSVGSPRRACGIRRTLLTLMSPAGLAVVKAACAVRLGVDEAEDGAPTFASGLDIASPRGVAAWGGD